LGVEYRRIARGYKKAKPPVAQFFISLPLADNERLSEDFVRENYADWLTKSNGNLGFDTINFSLFSKFQFFFAPSSRLLRAYFMASHFFIRSIHHTREEIASP